MSKYLILSRFTLTALLVLAACAGSFAQDGDKGNKNSKKMTASEVVAKHLESIGTREAITAAKSRVMVGTGTLVSTIQDASTVGGPAQFASQGNMVLFAMVFNASNYPYEKAAFDGREVTIGFPNGIRSRLANFLKSQTAIMKEGLLGGTLSSAWPLLDIEGRKVKVDYAGLSDFDDRPVHKLKYTPRGGDLRISLYFDAETFRHVASVYEYSIQPQMGAVSTASVGGQVTHYSLTERFSDFKTADKLTLPFGYSLGVSNTSQKVSPGGSAELQWKMKFENAYFNEPLEATIFKVS